MAIIIRELPAERFTPYSLARKLGAKALLESASFLKGRERYSLLLVEEAFRLEQRGRDVFFIKDGKRFRIKNPGRDILDACRYFADQHERADYDFPLPTGGVGFLSYEFASFCDKINIADKEEPLGLPLASFIFGHLWVVMDHYTDRMFLIAMDYKEAPCDIAALADRTESMLDNLDFSFMAAAPSASYNIEDVSCDQTWYLDAVSTVRDEIIAGNLLQAVPSRRLSLRTDMPAFEAYRVLRSSNPSPYMFFLDYGDYQLFGASPEVQIKVKHGEAVIRPIAGTRRRGRDAAEDFALEQELLADTKERAEHIMLVDLARNDLGRVCVPGSVMPAEYMVVERYSHVMHIVSEVRGRIADDYSGIDAFRASFPAGTVSGAPKIKAIETISRIEPVKRAFYAGSVGYIEPGGELDTCISIRTALKKGDMLYLQAGAGVVYDSVPEREFEETSEKLAALMHAIGLEEEHVPSDR
ncbi:chorismate-binding protein [Spirochaetia bacterium 38H-sp]|uniref:anthranilate synthase n=1 Tax=Rarispira pelagica TaxID=3141764 RepID=A0ABU9UB10_9SPIR